MTGGVGRLLGDRPTDRYSMRASASASARSSLRERLAVPERERESGERAYLFYARTRSQLVQGNKIKIDIFMIFIKSIKA